MTAIHTLRIFSDGSVSRDVESELAYVKPDWETERFDHHVRLTAPDPGIFPVSKTPESWPQTDFCWFPERWQWFHCDLLAMQMYRKLLSDLNPTERQNIINVFLKTTQSDRAYNNNNGTDLKNCYPTGQTNRGEDPKWESLITCGNHVRVLEVKKAAFGPNLGKEFARIDTFDASAQPPPVTPELLVDPRVHMAKIVNPGPPPYLTNFHYGQWAVGLPLPVPVLTNGKHFYPVNELG